MNILSSMNSYLSYKTKYFNSISDFVNNFSLYEKNLLNIFCINIRSINANFDQLLLFFENDVNFYRVDVIVLTET